MLFKSLFFVATALSPESLTIQLDQGVLDLSINREMSEPLRYEATLPAECSDTQIELRKSQELISFFHSGKSCPKGATLKVEVNPGSAQQITARVSAGVLQMENTTQLMRELKSIEAEVAAGSITSEVAALTPRREATNYAGSKADFSSIVDGPSLRLEVQSGVIQLED